MALRCRICLGPVKVCKYGPRQSHQQRPYVPEKPTHAQLGFLAGYIYWCNSCGKEVKEPQEHYEGLPPGSEIDRIS